MEEHDIYISRTNKYVNDKKYLLAFAFFPRRRHVRVRYRVLCTLFDRQKFCAENVRCYRAKRTNVLATRYKTRALYVRLEREFVRAAHDFPARFLVSRLPARTRLSRRRSLSRGHLWFRPGGHRAKHAITVTREYVFRFVHGTAGEPESHNRWSARVLRESIRENVTRHSPVPPPATFGLCPLLPSENPIFSYPTGFSSDILKRF